MSDQPIGVVTTVMHDTADLDGAIGFWTGILGLDVVYRTDIYAYLSQMTVGGPHLAFQLVPEVKSAKNRLHLDIRVLDRMEFEELVVERGGSKVDEQEQPGFPVWSVLADPEGNEFCVYEGEDPAA